MSFLVKEIVKNKIKQLNKSELLAVAKQYGFSLTDHEANEIIISITQSDFDVFSKKDLAIIEKKLTNITNKTTATKAKNLLEQIIDDYGLSGYFYE